IWSSAEEEDMLDLRRYFERQLIADWQPLAQTSHVKSLFLRTGDQPIPIEQIRKMPELEKLYCTSLKFDAALVRELAAIEHLKVLGLASPTLSEETLAALR